MQRLVTSGPTCHDRESKLGGSSGGGPLPRILGAERRAYLLVDVAP